MYIYCECHYAPLHDHVQDTGLYISTYDLAGQITVILFKVIRLLNSYKYPPTVLGAD